MKQQNFLFLFPAVFIFDFFKKYEPASLHFIFG